MGQDLGGGTEVYTERIMLGLLSWQRTCALFLTGLIGQDTSSDWHCYSVTLIL